MYVMVKPHEQSGDPKLTTFKKKKLQMIWLFKQRSGDDMFLWRKAKVKKIIKKKTDIFQYFKAHFTSCNANLQWDYYTQLPAGIHINIYAHIVG